MSWRTLSRVGVGLLGLAISAVLLLSVFFRWSPGGEGPLLVPRFDFGLFLANLPQHLDWVLPFILLTAAMIPLRALQWRATLPKRVPFRERYHLVAIGALVHNALPGKVGDIFRAFVIGRTQALPFVQALGSVAVCKLLELAALLILFGAALLGPFGSTVQRFSSALRAAAIICLALLVLVILLARHAHRLSALVQGRRRWRKLASFFSNVSVGLGAARTAGGMARALLLSIPPVLAPAVGYGLALEELGVKGGLFAGPVVLGAITLGQLAFGLPVGTALYYFATSWASRALGASAENAAALAISTHLATVLTQILLGLVSMAARRLRFRDLRRGSGVAAQAARQMGERPTGAAEA